MIGAGLALWLALAPRANACDALTEPPSSLQVAWVSRIGASVGAQTPMQVVRSVELQQLAKGRNGDVSSLLQSLGMLGAKGIGQAEEWKVSFFDVSRDALCRPMVGVPGDVRSGVPVCDNDEQGRWHTRARSWTGCGYLKDVVSAARTLDVFRLTWADGVRDGFCLLPLARLLAGRS